ncbi:hypothetical protein SXCC_04537 [Gluconacetobacter sp. SXCC-1]|nr:hypothetical protein SXCC_04537 [Gluconacetobacter sp. SXCC-1]
MVAGQLDHIVQHVRHFRHRGTVLSLDDSIAAGSTIDHAAGYTVQDHLHSP